MTVRGLLSSEYVSEARRPLGALPKLILFYFLTVTAIFFVLVFLSRPVSAVGPHGPFSSTSEKCEKCHAMHRTTNSMLLVKEDSVALCLSCHSGGIGADTAVMQGALMKATAPGSGSYVVLGSLLGGGFDAIGGSAVSTSKHILRSTAAPYGSDNMSSQIQITCVSCHTPHENDNYRLLRKQPGGSGPDMTVTWNGPYLNPDGSQDYAYEQRAYGPGLTYNPGTHEFSGTSKEVTRNYRSGLPAWCSSCHTRYMNRQDSAPYNAGDIVGAAVRYRHAVDVPVIGRHNIYDTVVPYDLPTDMPLQDVTGNGRTADDTISCLSCHFAHGTSAQMHDETASASLVADRGTLPTDSMLLRLDDRQVCQIACHRVVN